MHTLIRNLLQIKIPGTIIKFIANYNKGRKTSTTYRNHTFSQRQFKTGVPPVASSHQHHSKLTLQTCHHAEHRFRSWTQKTSPSHLHTQSRVQPGKYIQPYLHVHTVFSWTKQNNLTLNPDKTCTLFTPNAAKYKSNLNLKVNNTVLPMATLKGSGPSLP